MSVGFLHAQSSFSAPSAPRAPGSRTSPPGASARSNAGRSSAGQLSRGIEILFLGTTAPSFCCEVRQLRKAERAQTPRLQRVDVLPLGGAMHALKVDSPQHLIRLVTELPAHHLEAARVDIEVELGDDLADQVRMIGYAQLRRAPTAKAEYPACSRTCGRRTCPETPRDLGLSRSRGGSARCRA